MSVISRRWWRPGLGGLAAAAGLACAGAPVVVDLVAATSGVGPYRHDRRVAIRSEVDAAARRLLDSLRGARREVLKAVDLPGGQGRLELARFRSQGPPVQFFILQPGHQETQDFGFMVDLGGRGRIDYLVFNGGPLFDKAFQRMLWMDYHFIDTVGDGRVDVMVFNAVDLDGDHFFDEGVTAWVYDRNHDGLVDDAEYLGPFGSRPVERQGDDLILRLVTGERRISTTDPEVLGKPSRLLQQIRAAMP